MGWKPRVSVVLLIGLAALPLPGPLCVMACASTAELDTSHHGSSAKCDDAAQSAVSARFHASSDHDCSNHDAVRQVASTAAERIGLHVVHLHLDSSPRLISFDTPLPVAPTIESTRSPGHPQPPPVLRV